MSFHLFKDDDCKVVNNRFYVRPFQRFFVRKPRVSEPSEPSVSLVRTDLLLQLKEDEYTADAIASYKQSKPALDCFFFGETDNIWCKKSW